jgi:hypothetical protein
LSLIKALASSPELRRSKTLVRARSLAQGVSRRATCIGPDRRRRCALGDAAAEFGAGHAQYVAQHPHSGMSLGASTLWAAPLTLMLKGMVAIPCRDLRL